MRKNGSIAWHWETQNNTSDLIHSERELGKKKFTKMLWWLIFIFNSIRWKKHLGINMTIFKVYYMCVLQGRLTLNVGDSIPLAGFQDWAKWVSTSICLSPLADPFRCRLTPLLLQSEAIPATIPAPCILPVCFPSHDGLYHVSKQISYPRKGLIYPKLATISMNVWSFCFCIVLGIEPWASYMLVKHSTN